MTPGTIYTNANVQLLTVDPATNGFSVTMSSVFNPCATVNDAIHGTPNTDGTCSCNTGWVGTSGRCDTCDVGFLSPNCAVCKPGYGWKDTEHKKCVANQDCSATCLSNGTFRINTPSAGNGQPCPDSGSACAYGRKELRDRDGNWYGTNVADAGGAFNPLAYGNCYFDYSLDFNAPSVTVYKKCGTELIYDYNGGITDWRPYALPTPP